MKCEYKTGPSSPDNKHSKVQAQVALQTLTWSNVADFREQLRLLELAQALEVIELLRRQVIACRRKAGS